MSRHTSAPRLRRAARATGVLALVATATLLVAAAAPAAVLPPAPTVAPTILSAPSAVTTSTGATFRYAHPDLGVTFECSVDGRAFVACAATGISYSGLTAGAHTFSVAARNGTSALGPSASRSWTIDRTPPAIALVGPPGATAFNTATWASTCGAAAGVCGTATDAAGVSTVTVAVRQDASGRWWNGTAFAATTASYRTPAGTTSWRLDLALPPDGRYTVNVIARDALGNQTPAGSPATFAVVIDTVPPPAPTLTAVPESATTATSATVAFALPTAATAECATDDGAFGACASPVTVASPLGRHCVAVRAVGPSGLAGAPAGACWHSLVDRGFDVSGDVVGVLVPGVSRPVDLRLTNPYPVDLTVLTVTVSVGAATDRAGCDGTTNLVPVRGLVGTVVVPAGTTRTLSELGVPTARWPTVEMPNLATNQDACKGARFSLSFRGTATT